MERSRAKSRRSTRDSVAKKRRELRGGGEGGGAEGGKDPHDQRLRASRAPVPAQILRLDAHFTGSKKPFCLPVILSPAKI